MSLTEIHAKWLAQFEGKRFCSRADAARYLDISERSLDELLYAQQIESKYRGRNRKVVVASLLAYADKLPIDPPESAR